MTPQNLVAVVRTSIKSPIDRVWDALTNPEKIKKYMFGTTVITEWTKGSTIVWEGEYNGKQYADKGIILEFIPNKTLSYSHYSPLSGMEDKPENYHTVTIVLASIKGQTEVFLTQDRNNTVKSKVESEKNWKLMLESLKGLLE